MTEVSAGIIRRKDGKVLICRRGEGRRNAHLWEFPGGKREAGESAAACLERELLEELSLPVKELREVLVNEAQGIRFTFLSGWTDAEPSLTEHEAARFVHPREMLGLPFCPADTKVARRLALNAPPLRCFFWDFDGTLMDTYPMITRCFVRGCAGLGVTVAPKRALALLKESLGDACRRIAAENGLTAQQVSDAYDAEAAQALLDEVAPVAGIPETLATLTALGSRHYLVTHRGREALTMLQNAGLADFFTDCVTKEQGFPRKPAPDSCLHLLQKHGIAPECAVMIGDRPLDTQAGRAAGMVSCLLDGEGRFPEAVCDLRVNSAADLPETLCPRAIL